MARPGATERLGRILAMVPWIASQPGGADLDEVCRRFSIEPDQLAADLDVVFLVGLYPYTPDNLIEVDLSDDHVAIRYTNFFERPLRLTRDEGLALLAAGLTARSQPGHDPEGPLERGLAKLAAVLDIDLDDDLEVVVPPAVRELHATVESAIAERRVLHIDYFSHARNASTERDIEPHRLFTSDGAWYVDAFCRASDDQRVFRIDRITAIEPTEAHFELDADAEPHAEAGFDLGDRLPRVVLDLPADAAWVIEQYPVLAVEDLSGGRRRVTLPVSARPWLERLLLRLGPDVVAVEVPEELGGSGVAAAAARRLLAAPSSR